MDQFKGLKVGPLVVAPSTVVTICLPNINGLF